MAKALSMVVLITALFPKVQEKIAAELQNVFESKDQEATTDHLQQLTYLEMVIKETLRFWPLVPYSGREVSADIELG